MSHRDFQIEESRRDGAIHLWSSLYSSGNASRTLGYCGAQPVPLSFAFFTRLPLEAGKVSDETTFPDRIDSAKSQRREGWLSTALKTPGRPRDPT